MIRGRGRCVIRGRGRCVIRGEVCDQGEVRCVIRGRGGWSGDTCRCKKCVIKDRKRGGK